MSVKALVYSRCPVFLKATLQRIDNSPIGYRLARGVFWSIAGTVLSRGLMLVAMVIVARILGKTVFGELGIINSTVGMFGTFAGFGLGVTTTKYIAEFRQNDPNRAGRILSLSGLTAIVTGGIMAIAIYVSAPWLAVHNINAPHLVGALRIGSALLFLNALNGAQTGALSGFEAFKTIAKVNLFVGVISFPVLLCGVYFWGLTGALWALTINLCLNWLLNHLALRKEARRYNVPFTFNKCSEELPVLWRFSLPAVLGNAMVGPVNWVCTALLVNRPGGYGEMGVFSAANQWYSVLMFVPSLLNQILLPILSERHGQKKVKQSLKALIFAIKTSALTTFPIILLASVASPEIMRLYGAEFVRGWPTFVVILFTTGLQIVITPITSILVASGKMWVPFIWNMLWAIIYIFGTRLLLGYGSLGLASAKMLSYILLSGGIIAYIFWLARSGIENGLGIKMVSVKVSQNDCKAPDLEFGKEKTENTFERIVAE